MSAPDIVVTTSLDLSHQTELLNQYLEKHRRSLSGSVRSKFGEPDVSYLDSAFELVEFAFKNHQALALFMSSFAVGVGLKVGALVGKVFETLAAELGKDLYTWLKASLQRAIRDSKAKDARRAEDHRLGEIRIVIRGAIIEARFFAYIYYRYAERHSSKEIVDADEEAIQKASEFFYLITPFVTYLLSVHPELMAEARQYLHMAVNVTNHENWNVSVGDFLEFEILEGAQIKLTSIRRDGAREKKDETQEKMVRECYDEFLKITQLPLEITPRKSAAPASGQK